MIFWNTAGLLNKGLDFWNYVKRFDYISLCETCIGDKECINLQKDYQTHTYRMLLRQKKKKERKREAEFQWGKNRNWGENDGEIIKSDTERVLHLRFKENRNIINIIMVYNSRLENNIGSLIEKHVNIYENK